MFSLRFMNETTDTLAYTIIRLLINTECIYLTVFNRSLILYYKPRY